MRLVNIANLLGKAISRGTSPRPAQMLQVPLDFTVDQYNQFTWSMSQHIRNNTGIAGIQSVKIDNSNNPQTLQLSFDNGDVIVCPAYAQAIFPVLFSGDVLSFVAYSTGGVAVNLTFLNTREQAQLWTAKIPLAGTVNVTGSTVYMQPLTSGFIDASLALALGGTAQLLLAANGNRKLLTIRNPASAASQNIAAAEPVYLGFTTAAPAVGGLGTWELLPGEQLPQFLMQTTEAIYFNAATTGHRLTCKYM